MILVAPVTGSVWKIECSVGDQVEAGAILVVMESMKMEFPVEAETDGRITRIIASEGHTVDEGAPLVELE